MANSSSLLYDEYVIGNSLSHFTKEQNQMLKFNPTKLKTKYAGDPDRDLRWYFADYEKHEYPEIDDTLDTLERELRRIDVDLSKVFVDETSEKLDNFFTKCGKSSVSSSKMLSPNGLMKAILKSA